MATTSSASSTVAPVTSNSTSTPVSIATNSSAGAAGGSVINVSSIVSQLVSAQQAPQQALIASKTQAVTAQVSALGTLKSALATFQDALSSLSSPTQFNAQTADTSDKTVFSASASSSAAAGTYQVTVANLASAQQLVSGTLSATGPIGDGTLTLSLGGSSFNLTIDSTNDTLSGIAAAVNSSSSNPGISATVIQGTDGAHLLLTSSQTGASNNISVTESDGGTALSAITYGTGNTSHYTQTAQALDASFSVAGVPQTSASNTISNALNGVTLTLLGPSTGTGATLTVANDTSTVAQNISAFVTAYNTLQTTISPLGSFDSSTDTAGTLLGNPVYSGTINQIQSALHSFVGSSAYNSLASIGITTNSDGTLSLNANTLQTALATNFSAVSNLFSSANGVAARLNLQITTSLGSAGALGTYAATLQTQESDLTDQSNQLAAQAAAMTTSLTQQYSALNALLSSLQTTSSQLSQTFATLPLVQGVQQA